MDTKIENNNWSLSRETKFCKTYTHKFRNLQADVFTNTDNVLVYPITTNPYVRNEYCKEMTKDEFSKLN